MNWILFIRIVCGAWVGIVAASLLDDWRSRHSRSWLDPVTAPGAITLGFVAVAAIVCTYV